MDVRVLFVCLGNICRSPMAEHVFRSVVAEEGLSRAITCESCGTASYHIGEPPDRRAARVMAVHGIDCSGKRASRIRMSDFDDFDYIVCMDGYNLDDVLSMEPPGSKAVITTLLDGDVDDPWYTGDFERTFREVSTGSRALLERIRRERGI